MNWAHQLWALAWYYGFEAYLHAHEMTMAQIIGAVEEANNQLGAHGQEGREPESEQKKLQEAIQNHARRTGRNKFPLVGISMR